MSISARFNMFCDELRISKKKKSIISLRYNSINKKLNNDFWSINTNYGGVYAGCYGRETANDGVKEIDLIFEMPSHLLNAYEECAGNPQERFLEDVRKSIAALYPNTSINTKKRCVRICFSDGMCFFVYPVFKNEDGDYLYANVEGNGQWGLQKRISFIDAMEYGELIDTLAYEFLLSTKKSYNSYGKFDIMCQDFFRFLMNQPSLKTSWDHLGSDEKIYNFENFRYKAIVAHFKAKRAVGYGISGKNWTAGQKWREIFGNRFPETVLIDMQINKLNEKATSLYQAQKNCANILSKRLKVFIVFQLLCALVMVSGILIIGYTESFGLGLMLFTVASVSFISLLYIHKHNWGNVITKHKQSAVRILKIKEELIGLLLDLNVRDVEIAQVKKRRDELEYNMTRVYQGTLNFNDKRYVLALEKINAISKIKKKLTVVHPKKINIPVWQHNKFYLENTVQCLMNYRN